MGARLRYLRDVIRKSYWFMPAIMIAAAIGLSVATLWLDTRLDAETVANYRWVLYTGGPEGARAVLTTVAGSMITVAGVVFSITIVALTLASSQFGPRVLTYFMRDRGNQIVLGTFIATFLYCLLALRSVRSADESGAGAVVPHLAITVGIGMALASLGVLVYFIHHVATSIQAPHLVARLAAELNAGIAILFPEAEEADPRAPVDPPPPPAGEAGRLVSPRAGYLDAVDLDRLVRAAEERDLHVRLEYRPGQFVVRGSTLARVWPAAGAAGDLDEAFVIGSFRTAIQDLEFPLTQLVEVAVRALSPGINDPFTSIACIDYLGAALCEILRRGPPAAVRRDARGAVRLVVERPLTLDGACDAAFHQIRQNAGAHVAVHLRLLETLARVGGCVRAAGDLDPLLRHAGLVVREARERVGEPLDREEIEGRYRAVLEVAARKRAEPDGAERGAGACAPPGER